MKHKILIIEDEEDVARFLGKRFRAAGYDILTVPDGLLAVQEAHTFKPDLILLDLMLPGGGGHLVLERLKSSVHTKNIPVIVLTAVQDPSYRKKIERYDVVEAYLQKPYDAQDLLGRVKNILQG